MQKLINYFKQGKGHGLMPMLIFSTIVSLLLWGISYAVVKEIPQNADLNAFVTQLPTITIQNGEVIEPANTNKAYAFKGHPVFYLQTDRNEISPFSPDGIYLTRKLFAFVGDGQLQQGSYLSGNATVTPDMIMKVIRSFVLWTPIILGAVYFIILWLFYLLVVGVSALISLIFHFKLNKGAIWRSASFATITVLIIDIVMSFLGYSVGRNTYPMVVQLITVILLVMLIAFGIREKKEEKVKTLKKNEKKK